MIKPSNLFPIGIGTWGINSKNPAEDLNALCYSFEQGQNFLSLYMLYDNGAVVRQIGKLLKKNNRERIFLSVNLEPTIRNKKDIRTQLNEYLKLLEVDYVDNLQIHSPLFSKIPLIEVYQEISNLVKEGKARYIGLSNASPEQLVEINDNFKLDFFEGVYNLECKTYESLGVLRYCHSHDIRFICYQPLRRNRTALRNYPILNSLAQKYQKTQNQIILNWLIYEKNLLPLVKSTNIERINQNIVATNFCIAQKDNDLLNQFHSQEFENIVIDWSGNGGVTIDQLPNQFA